MNIKYKTYLVNYNFLRTHKKICVTTEPGKLIYMYEQRYSLDQLCSHCLFQFGFQTSADFIPEPMPMPMGPRDGHHSV